MKRKILNICRFCLLVRKGMETKNEKARKQENNKNEHFCISNMIHYSICFLVVFKD